MSSPVLTGVLTGVLCVVPALGLASCQSYNEKVRAPVRHFEAGRFEEARAAFADDDRTGSRFLSGAEAGMAALAAGRFDLAREHFTDAVAAVRDVEERAALGVESLAEVVTDWALNEGASAYEGEGYERVMLHACLGLAYLGLGRPADVLVEARRVDELLTREQELYDARYAAGGLGHFLSALAYELQGKPGEAYIDYQRLEEKGLGGELTERALVRLSERLGRRADHERWTERFGAGDDVPPDAGSIVLVGGVGMGPVKRETRLAVPVDGGVFAWAVPGFQPTLGGGALELRFPDAGQTLRASVLEDVTQVATENLEDRLAFLAARSAVRGLLKRQLAEQLRDNEHGPVLGLAADLFTLATERADLRAWRTLPATWQAARAHVAPGEPVRVVVAVQGGEAVELGTFRLSPGEPMFVLARSIQGRLYAHAVGGERAESAAPAASRP